MDLDGTHQEDLRVSKSVISRGQTMCVSIAIYFPTAVHVVLSVLAYHRLGSHVSPPSSKGEGGTHPSHIGTLSLIYMPHWITGHTSINLYSLLVLSFMARPLSCAVVPLLHLPQGGNPLSYWHTRGADLHTKPHVNVMLDPWAYFYQFV